MNSIDQAYLDALILVFDSIHLVFSTDATLVLTDLERIIKIIPAKTFNLNIVENSPIVKGGVPDKVLHTKKKAQAHFPKETLGFPVIVNGAPIINPATGNLIGTLLYGISQEQELNLIHMAEKLAHSAEQLTSSAQELTASSISFVENNKQINEIITKATVGADQMESVIAYILSVANTTNMLGLNASIEAARAGEHGRGFSIVADEIRKLSTQSKTAMSDISDNLNAMRLAIDNISKCVDTFISSSELQSEHAEALSQESEMVTDLSVELLKLAQAFTR